MVGQGGPRFQEPMHGEREPLLFWTSSHCSFSDARWVVDLHPYDDRPASLMRGVVRLPVLSSLDGKNWQVAAAVSRSRDHIPALLLL